MQGLMTMWRSRFTSTKSQLALAAERERRAGEHAGRRRVERREELERRFRLSQEKAKQKRRGH